MKRLIVFAVAALVLGSVIGCESTGRGIAAGLAEKPYRDAMEDGRMSSTEYMEKRDELRQVSRPTNPSKEVYPLEPWE